MTVTAVFFLVGILFLITGILLYRHARRLKDVCSKVINALITNLNCEIRNDVCTYSPIIEWTYNGNSYKKESKLYSKKGDKYQVGKTIKIMINPNDPNEFYVKSKELFLISILFIVASIIFLLLGVKFI